MLRPQLLQLNLLRRRPKQKQPSTPRLALFGGKKKSLAHGLWVGLAQNRLVRGSNNQDIHKLKRLCA